MSQPGVAGAINDSIIQPAERAGIHGSIRSCYFYSNLGLAFLLSGFHAETSEGSASIDQSGPAEDLGAAGRRKG